MAELDPETIERLREEFAGVANLQPCAVEDGIDRFLEQKSGAVTESTIAEYRAELRRFAEFLQSRQITDFTDLDGRTIDAYRRWRRHDSSDEVDQLSPKTVRDTMYLVRNLVRYLESIDAVRPGLSDSVQIPDLSDDDGVRETDLAAERVADIREHLRQFEYASLEHVVWELFVETGRRTGGLLALDVGDVHLDGDEPCLKFVNRPPETRLKNGQQSEGRAAIQSDVADILSDYLETTRPDVTDESGREPLLATTHGRPAESTLRRYVYKWTRPCHLGAPCPHDRDPATCDAAGPTNAASHCPSSRSPHSIRHGYISELRREAFPIALLSDRVDASEETIRRHYDESSSDDRLDIRRDMLEQHRDGKNGGGYL